VIPELWISIYNNRIVNLSRAWHMWADGRQAASADWLQAGIEGSGGGGQAKIAMSRQRHGLRGWTDGYKLSRHRVAWRLVYFSFSFNALRLLRWMTGMTSLTYYLPIYLHTCIPVITRWICVNQFSLGFFIHVFQMLDKKWHSSLFMGLMSLMFLYRPSNNVKALNNTPGL